MNISVTSAQVTPHDTLRRNLCSASRAISIRRLLVSSRNRRIRPSAAAARSASDAPAVSGAGSTPTTVISSRSAWISGAAVNQSPGQPAAEPAAHFRRGAAAPSRLARPVP